MTPHPPRPLLVYDGACGFCKRWIARWKRVVGDRADFAPAQEVASRFPHVTPAAFAEAVHLIEPDGSVTRGAEAVFRLLALGPARGMWLWAYRSVPGVRAVTEALYRLVARHRPSFDRVTTWLWGWHVVPPGESRAVSLYLRLLGVVFAVAFASLGSQLLGLIGSRGILPAAETLGTVALDPRLGASRFWLLPSLCWISASDGFLTALWVAGLGIAAALAMGFAPVLCLAALWTIYLSLTAVCRDFLWFQWDGLLLEAAFLGIFLAPWTWRLRSRAPSRLALWSTRWLLFRLLVASAAVKLASGDPAWRDLTALRYHYETQPLPTPLAWYFHQLPLGFHRISALVTLAVEGLVPFLIFAPRRPRILAAAIIAAHQILIALTGNFGFFNLLTLALCVPLLDNGLLGGEETPHVGTAWGAWIRRPVLVGLVLVSLAPFLASFGTGLIRRMGPLPAAYQLLTPFRTVNQYGLFAVMTQERPEIQIEGSRDGRDWKTYRFRYKPGEVTRGPGFVAPHQPRLDWQMWFAALSDFRSEGWLLRFCERLLQGSKPVLGLLAGNPFPEGPPRYIRPVLYRYRFTDPATRHTAGAWWSRERLGLYAPVLMLQDGTLTAAGPELQHP